MTRISRRSALATTAAVVGGLAGCVARGTSTDLTDLEEWPPATEDELRFWTWQQYWGNQAIAFEHAADLEDVSRDTLPSREQRRRLDGSPPDVVHLLSREFGHARDAGDLQPLPTHVMPSWPPDETLRSHDLSYYEQDEAYVGYPQTPVAFSLGYHSDLVERPTSWGALWDESFSGLVGMPRDPVLSGQIAALYTGQDPTDPNDIDAVTQALADLAPQVREYWDDWRDCWHAFEHDEYRVAVLPRPRMCLCSQDYNPVTYVAPEEGVPYGQSTLAITADAAHPAAAASFIDWASDFKTGTETAWDADEWTKHFTRPLGDDLRETYRSAAERAGYDE